MLASIRSRIRTFLRCDSGGPAVEFAIIAPILLVMTTGVVDFGLAIRDKTEVEAAARSGLQKGFGNMWDDDGIAAASKAAYSTDPDAQDAVTVENYASCYCDGALTGTGDTCTETTKCGGGGNPDFYLTVNVSVNHDMMFNYYFVPSVVTLTGTATARAQP